MLNLQKQNFSSSEFRCNIRNLRSESGVAYIVILFILIILSLLSLAFLQKVGTETSATMNRGINMQAHYLAESAANHALWRLLNEPSFPVSETTYYMHTLGQGRYGYKVRRHTDTTFATIATVGAIGESVVNQSYVLHVKPPSLPPFSGCPKNLLFVVDDALNLTSTETARKTLMEGWNATVTPISDTASSLEIFDGIAANDVIYISQEITSLTNASKLRDAEIGIVNEEYQISNDLGLTSGEGSGFFSSMDILDNTHYITSEFSLGALTLFDPAYDIYTGGGMTLAPDLLVLGKCSNILSAPLVAIETGGSLWDSGTAAGRRVQVPWGDDFSALNADGQSLMMRAIEWAAGMDGGCGGSFLGPFAHWKLDDETGLTAVDSEGGHDGTLTNGPAWTAGQLDGALDFDGMNDYVDVGTFDVSGSGLTLLGWFNAETLSVDGRIISKAKSTSAADAWWQLSVISSQYLRLRIKAGGTTTTFADSSMKVTTGQWYFAAATYDNTSGSMKLYLNGTEVASGTHAVGGAVDVDPTVPVAIGANGSVEQLFDGVLDDVRIYDRALSGSEIFDLYGVESDLVVFAHWKLDDEVGLTAVDSESGHDGTLVDGPAWTTGQVDGALDFDGVDDYVSVGAFDVSGTGLTLMGWFNADTFAGDGRIISKANGTSASDAWWQLSVISSQYLRLRVKAGGTTTTFADSSVNLATGQWYFAVATYDNTSGMMKLYLDGVEVASGTHAVGGPVDVHPSVPVAIGANGTVERFFGGVLDDVRVYDRPLSSIEITNLYANGSDNDSYLDQFNSRTCSATVDYAGSDGLLDWSPLKWTETGELNNPCSGLVQIADDPAIPDPGSYRLMLDERNRSIARKVDLSGFTSATLRFDFRQYNYPTTNESFIVSVSGDGGSNWTELENFHGIVSHTEYQAAVYDISPYIASNTMIRFETTGSNTIQTVYVDNVRINEGTGGGGVVFENFSETKNPDEETFIDIAKPSGTVVGDLLIAAVVTDEDTSSNITPPSGWNEISLGQESSAVTFGVWWKLADAGEPSTYQFDWTGDDPFQSYGWIMRFTGHDPSAPIATASTGSGSNRNPLSTNVITGSDGNLILRLGGFDDDDITVGNPGLSGHTAITMESSSTSSNRVSGGAGYTYQITAGDTGTSNFNLTGREEYRTVTIAIRPEL